MYSSICRWYLFHLEIFCSNSHSEHFIFLSILNLNLVQVNLQHFKFRPHKSPWLNSNLQVSSITCIGLDLLMFSLGGEIDNGDIWSVY